MQMHYDITSSFKILMSAKNHTVYHLIGELMENATFCCLFNEITLSTHRDIKDFVSQSHGAKFHTVNNF
jgi:hypothetical protein